MPSLEETCTKMIEQLKQRAEQRSFAARCVEPLAVAAFFMLLGAGLHAATALPPNLAVVAFVAGALILILGVVEVVFFGNPASTARKFESFLLIADHLPSHDRTTRMRELFDLYERVMG